MTEKIQECVPLSKGAYPPIKGGDPLIKGFLWGKLPPSMGNDW